jgi:hypothetical protein
VTVPLRWTDRASESFDHRLAVEGLADLAQLVAALGYPRLAGEERA